MLVGYRLPPPKENLNFVTMDPNYIGDPCNMRETRPVLEGVQILDPHNLIQLDPSSSLGALNIQFTTFDQNKSYN